MLKNPSRIITFIVKNLPFILQKKSDDGEWITAETSRFEEDVNKWKRHNFINEILTFKDLDDFKCRRTK